MSAVIEEHHDDLDHGPAKGSRLAGCSRRTTKTSARCTCGSALMMFLIGGAMALVIRAELFQPGLQLVHLEFFNQMTTMHALDNGVRCGHAGLCWPCELVGADDGRCARHGSAAHEQLVVLDLAVCFRHAACYSVHGWRRSGLWLDMLRATGRLHTPVTRARS